MSTQIVSVFILLLVCGLNGLKNVRIENCYAGDVNLAVYISSWLTCDDQGTRDYSYIRHVALKAHFHRINVDQSLIFKQTNLTLGYVQFEDCFNPINTAGFAQRLRPIWTRNDIDSTNFCRLVPEPDEENLYYIVGAVGGATSDCAIVSSYIQQRRQLSLVAVTATSPLLADNDVHPYVLRMSPPDSIQVKVIADMLENQDWTYIVVLYEDNNYGRGLYKALFHNIDEIKTKRICIAYTDVTTSLNANHAATVVGNILKYPRAKVLVFLGGLEEDILELLKDEDHIIITTDGNSDIPSKFRDSDYFIGSIFIKLSQAFIPGLEIYNAMNYESVLKAEKIDRWYWEEINNCCFDMGGNCTACSRYSNLPRIDSYYSDYRSDIDAVTVYALAIDHVLKNNCSMESILLKNFSHCFDPLYLKRVMLKSNFFGLDNKTIEFHSSGYMKSNYILMRRSAGKTLDLFGAWDGKSGLTLFQKSFTNETLSKCSTACQKREAKISITHCCWECIKCRDNEVKQVTVDQKEKCVVCPINTWPDQSTFTECNPIAARFVKFISIQYIAMSVVSGFGLALTLLLLGFYMKHKEHPLIKASAFSLSCCSLTGLCLAFVTVLTFGGMPTVAICTTRNIIYHASVTVPYSGLLVKTLRIFLVFKASHKGYRPPVITQSRWMHTLLVVFNVIQVIVLVAVSLIFTPTPSLVQPNILEPVVETSCPISVTPSFWIPFGYNLALIAVSSYLGYATRSLPDNFQDSKCIFTSAACCCLLWLAFIPSLLNISSGGGEEMLVSLVLLVSSFVMVCTVFLPKIFGVLSNKELQIKFYGTTTNSNHVADTTAN